ncbi:MAG TPA: ATP-binding cassette domain-containing protein [Nocardioides sp.]|jgi:ABC-type multidrug transport system ATPase subunit
MTLQLTDCTYGYSRRNPPLIRDLSYELPDGLTILLGPNGAGKTTLLKLAASVLTPRTGSVKYGQLSGFTKEFRTKVSWMPQTIAPLPPLTVRQYVAYVGWLKGLGRRDAWDRAVRALDQVELAERADEKSHRLSGGQLRRMGLAAALVHDAEALLLDEPTAGLDPHQRRVFRDLLGALSPRVRVLMSTHDVADLAQEADHVTVLESGRILHSGPTRTFLAHGPRTTPDSQVAEAAYTALLTSAGADLD